MRRRSQTVIPFSRDYRRLPGWNLGGPRGPRRRRPTDPRLWLKLVIGLAGAGLILLPLGADAVNAALGPKSDGGCRVVKVIDGDTVLLWCGARGVEKVRLKGFDAPEVFSPQCPSEWAQGVAATWHLRRLFFQADHIIVAFAGEDRYGRRLASIATDGGPIASRMIADGHARVYAGGTRQGWCT